MRSSGSIKIFLLWRGTLSPRSWKLKFRWLIILFTYFPMNLAILKVQCGIGFFKMWSLITLLIFNYRFKNDSLVQHYWVFSVFSFGVQFTKRNDTSVEVSVFIVPHEIISIIKWNKYWRHELCLSSWDLCGKNSFQLHVLDVFYPTYFRFFGIHKSPTDLLKNADKGIFKIMADQMF